MTYTRDQYINAMANGICGLAGIVAEDVDGSSNWMMFVSDVTPLVDSLISRGIFKVKEEPGSG